MSSGLVAQASGWRLVTGWRSKLVDMAKLPNATNRGCFAVVVVFPCCWTFLSTSLIWKIHTRVLLAPLPMLMSVSELYSKYRLLFQKFLWHALTPISVSSLGSMASLGHQSWTFILASRTHLAACFSPQPARKWLWWTECLCTPQFLHWSPNSQCDSIWKWGLWKEIMVRWVHEDGVPWWD